MKAHVVALALCASAAQACSGGPDRSTEPRLDRIAIQLAPEVTTLMVNDTARAHATGFSQIDVPYPIGPVTWRSSNSSILQVDSTGLVQGRGIGSAYVVAAAQGVKDSIPLAVAGTLHALPITTSETWDLTTAP